MSSPAKVYGSLDGMRGVAAIAVVMLHARALFTPLWAPNGGLAVDLFFVMSGFIIAHAYEAKMRDSLTRLRFLTLRLIRLYPLYLLGLLLGITEAVFEIKFGRTQAWTTPHLLSSILFNAPILPAPGPPDASIFPMNPPGWSLFFELVINAAYALALPRLSNRVLGGIVGAAAVALVALALWRSNLNVGSEWATFWGGLARVAYSFTLGVLLYRLRDRWARFRINPFWLLAISGALFLIDAGPFTAIYHLACVLLIMPGLVALGSATEPGPRLLPTFRFLGLTSYAVYCLHYPLVMATEGVVRKLLPNAGAGYAPWIGTVFLAGLLIACAMVDKIYDAPVRKWLTRLGSPKPAVATAAGG